ncbi:flagellar hook assembly protein FlgD [Hydrogenovibrio marinus]|uniref:Basal-body rod modification protein FlgD n=1 Tax=Hydrogenovibrio marinus TaxID=28885 RepID=A0A066ZZ97_HYDMR|nr:flagellar hook capping FlgD N-terminal domain-containing protein [Hydrogenovibrio marinus]KDN95440.1 flagellar hook capping protein [Hydrogenovibrio marinus]BBN59930.1 basal-body rod modification protein FlgD [Hydrogenovibrio marinus]
MSTVSSTSSDYIKALQQSSNTAASAPNQQLGQADFLRLLTTQLQNQDPNKPMDPKDFVTNLTQMSQLQSTQDLNTSMTAMLSGFQGLQTLQAASIIGKSVQANGEDLTYTQGQDAQFRLTAKTDQALTDVKVVVSKDGEAVKNISVGDLSADKTINWDGTDDNGNALADGTYKLTAYGTDSNGSIQQISTVVGTKVNSVAIGTDGKMKLTLATGEQVAMDAVREIGQ